MDVTTRIESAVESALDKVAGGDCPPLLASAARYAVFPGGARIRPRLALAVAAACGDDRPWLTDAAAASIELMHCASLVHDDLPCFDDAEMRRGKPSTHLAYGEPLAVLVGDALIVRAFEVAGEAVQQPEDCARALDIVRIVARSAGMPRGIAAGQSWELEPTVGVGDYQRAKTGSLFAAASEAGAAAAGYDAEAWWILGDSLGEAYQVADDIRDVTGNPDELGKPVGRDAELGRPSAVAQYGVEGAKQRLKRLVDTAMDSIPECPGRADLKTEIEVQSRRFLPAELIGHAA